jgi:nucleotide-binding universal stress UspA family protein
LSLAANYDAQLVLVHMVPPLADAAYAPAVLAQEDDRQWREAVRGERARKLKELVQAGAFPKEPLYLVGTDLLSEGILSTAAEYDVDLMVMGANRRTSPRIASHVPCATTHQVLSDAFCPVLTVRG